MGEIDFGIRKPVDFIPLSENILVETIIPQFERIVEKFPDQPAIKDEIGCLTYRELNNAVNNLAYAIVEIAGSTDKPIAFLHDRELISIISMLAITKLGRASVGLHPSNSNEQLAAYLSDSTSNILISSPSFRNSVNYLKKTDGDLKTIFMDRIDTEPKHGNPLVQLSHEGLFGIFYTSGSTGKPKGVMIGHLYKSQSIHYQTNGWFFSPSDKVSLVTSSCYLASHPSIFGALLNGGLLCIFDLQKYSAKKALDWIIDEGLTAFRCTPSIFRNIFTLAPKDMIFSNLRFVTLGGEPITSVDIELFKQHTDKDCTLVNNYSSTEAGSLGHFPVHHDLPPFQGLLPAGYPAPGKEILILDEDGGAVEQGEIGEIVVRSKYLNLGYWRNEELTALKYRTDLKDPSFRFSYSGDLGRFRDGGILEVIGRKDTQVKIRGFRVQLEIIDLALRNLPGVRDAATIVYGNVQSGERLAAYIVMDKKDLLSVSQIRKILSEKIPGYMIPSRFIFLDQLPRTPTGKLSRRDLPAPTADRPELNTAYVAPQIGLETEIAKIWGEMLELDEIGIEDNFFELGGDSLLMLQMSLAIEEATGMSFPQQFFKDPTIKYLCALIDGDTQSLIKEEIFVVNSVSPNEATTSSKKRKKSKLSKIARHLTTKNKKRELDLFYRFLDRQIGKYLVTMPYQKAIAWSVRWSRNSIIRNLFYTHRRKLFERWLAILREGDHGVSGSFQHNLLTNMFFQIPKAVSKKEKDPYGMEKIYLRSRITFWRTLGELIEKTPAEEIPLEFPMTGLEYLQEAKEQGKGVILLSFHGPPHSDGFLPLAKVLGVGGIPTISYLIPMRQSRYDERKDEISETSAFTMNAEIALYGQKILQQGGVVNFASDANDTRGRTYKVMIGNRQYQVKGGFAEMALNTGAVIIPFTRYCLADGRVQMEFFPQLEVGEGTREEIVERLIRDYGTFMESCWYTHSDAMSWTKMRKHLGRPKGSEDW